MKLRVLLVLAALALSACRCENKPATSAPPGISAEEIRSMMGDRPPDCAAFQILEGPDGKKQMKCVALKAADGGGS